MNWLIKALAGALLTEAALLPSAAGAQMWFDVTGIMQPVVLNPCPDGQCPGVSGDADDNTDGDRQNLAVDAGNPSVADAALAYAPSDQVRQANLARFVSHTRAQDPAGAAAMEQLFASTDVFAALSAALAPYGYAIDNVGDAYAFWWINSWEGAQGSNRTPSQAEMQAVQAQAHRALAATPELAGATDAQKQEMAEAMWIQAALIGEMVEAAQGNPELMPQVQQAVRQGARASGLHLDAMRLTENGFVPR